MVSGYRFKNGQSGVQFGPEDQGKAMKAAPQILYCPRCGRRTDTQFISLLPKFWPGPPEITKRFVTEFYFCPQYGFLPGSRHTLP